MQAEGIFNPGQLNLTLDCAGQSDLHNKPGDFSAGHNNLQ